jgi:phytoene/squalene synthetase
MIEPKYQNSQSLAETITWNSSKQTFYTIRLFADRALVADAYRAYGYFRWLDDLLDGDSTTAMSQSEKVKFIIRQKNLLNACYRGEIPDDFSPYEAMLVELVGNDSGANPGLNSYLYNMMAVMEFDTYRRGRVISQDELNEYTRLLATSVTDALHYFIAHDDPPPCRNIRYQAVTAAHITHMLRDTYEDLESGYFNISGEYLAAHGITPQDVDLTAYQHWVNQRITLARHHFQTGRQAIRQIKSLRCRLAGLAYIARFEWVLRAIENDNYRLRSEYPQRKSLGASLWMVLNMLVSIIPSPKMKKAHLQSVHMQGVNEP